MPLKLFSPTIKTNPVFRIAATVDSEKCKIRYSVQQRGQKSVTKSDTFYTVKDFATWAEAYGYKKKLETIAKEAEQFNLDNGTKPGLSWEW